MAEISFQKISNPYRMRPRVMPCLLLQGRGLVKTVRFQNPTYLGDPRNVVKIFNDKEVDELCLLDICAAKERRGPDMELLKEVLDECFMPVGYGGGIRTLEQAEALIRMGVEKVFMNTAAIEDPDVVARCARSLGSQSVVVSVDVVQSKWTQKYEVYSHSTGRSTKMNPIEFSRRVQSLGAGEILLNSVERDGTMTGYDLALVRSVADAVTIPVVACGGAANVEDLARVVYEGGASAAAAGSIFVFHGRLRGVLISFPDPVELDRAFPQTRATTASHRSDTDS